MTSPAQQQSKPSTACDPAEIGWLTCASARITREAEVIAESKPTLDGYRASYASAREAYTAVWWTSRAEVTDARGRLDAVRKELRCRLDGDDRDRLDKIWDAVKAELTQCVGDEGCHVPPCAPDSSVGDDETVAELAGRIQVLREQAAERGTAFEELLTEITARASRAAAATAEVADLVSAAATAIPASDPEKALKEATFYARAHVVGWRLDHVDGGFPQVEDYLDCLCHALTAVLRLWAAIVVLEGARAQRVCIAGSSPDTCAVLLADPLAAVLDRYAQPA